MSTKLEKQITVLNQKITLSLPRRCSFCSAIFQKDNLNILAEGYTSNSGGSIAEHGYYFLLVKCSFCESLITDIFSITSNKSNRDRLNTFAPRYRQLKRNKAISYEPHIAELSPKFVSIYDQAFDAESKGLDELSGMGYRKALEFLIKDFLIHKYPDKKANIERNVLGKVIGDYFGEFPRLQKLAKAANWIGTDATHFVPKYADQDIQAMKNYIYAAQTFISGDLMADEAESFIKTNS
ncbi:hypothetical protein WEU39_06440 [Pediococcus pentosaceus]